MRQIRVCELFAGIGSQIQALKNLGIPCESVISEIDKYAIKSYEAIHGPTENLGDICEIRELPNGLDLLTYSFPCQDLSLAGLHEGMHEGSGTRSSLLWEVGRLLKHHRAMTDMGLAEMPKILLMENVPAILNKKNIGSFQKWIDELTELGYTSSYAVLNAKDFGIPQNRKRCFMVSTLDGKKFRFPTGVPLDKCLRDMLEDDVDPTCYFTQAKIEHYEEHLQRHKAVGHGFGWHPTYGEGISVSVTAKPDRHCSEMVITKGCYPQDLYNGNLKVRLLTPKECWRLMGFSDEAFDKAKAAGISKTQLYKQAGNSIVVNVLEAIFRGIYIEETWE